ncbi:hypothetical protein CYMTET_28145 [Cymbomonas tetramitiformis]|uniref:DNA2/NAM7 helicase-like C-terminal domain-containing protein n=1 Tax=Cymbomonas tetramitiformis TaxID=36881 RepID=A0AAE0KWG1_9CHLO|nr:hypothetical protein CYMTET_28145 [Cymbomonas tetramitiformis]
MELEGYGKGMYLQMAVDSLRNVVEKIHGPPGTGKSSTIYHIIHSRIPPGKSVLVTCARNKAVNSMVDKLRSRHKDVVVWGNINAPDLSPASKELFLEQLAHRERQQQSADAALAPPDPSRRAAPKPDEKMVRQSILSRVRIHLCTIDSTTRFLVRWKEEMKGHESSRKLELHTVIVDEAGCASESSMSLLVWLEPKNLILVGDHKQLGPFTQAPDGDCNQYNLRRSVLERCINGGTPGSAHTLTEQYRMHPELCDVVSRLFYQEKLVTNADVATRRTEAERLPVTWVPVRGNVSSVESSYYNEKEVEAAVIVAQTLRAVHGNDISIAVLTFYKGQVSMLNKAIAAARVRVNLVNTAEKCQGAEFDYTVISTVRGESSTIGFLKDPKRVCVALSRAKLGLIVVGNDEVLPCEWWRDWNAVYMASRVVRLAWWREALLWEPAGSSEKLQAHLLAGSYPGPEWEQHCLHDDPEHDLGYVRSFLWRP